MSTRIAIAGVSERDIDLLLLEEFQSSASFQIWFVAQTLGPTVSLGRYVGAERSVTHSIGESDLEVTFIDEGNCQTRLMIENKVAAGLQPLQAERYLKRGHEYVALGKCTAFHTVVVAPSRYFGSSEAKKGFGYKITYEQILTWFQQQAELGERRHYKVALLKSAIEKGTLGYQPVEDALTTDFWHAYWLLSLERAPELEMKEPKRKPSGSGFVPFRPTKLPRGIDIVHKMNHGFVDLQLRGMGKNINHARTVLKPFLEEGMTVASAAGSAAIRYNVPRLKPFASMKAQEQDARAAIDKAMELLAWFQKHAPLLTTMRAEFASVKSQE